jgi:O-antigen ligase
MEPNRIIRYFYYAFIFSIPFEAVDLGIGILGTVPKLLGILLVAATVVQLRMCWKMPPKSFWLFASYLCLYSVWGIFSIHSNFELAREIILRFFTLFQLLILFWVSYNLLQNDKFVKGTLLTLTVSCTIVGGLILAGLGGEDVARATVGDANPNLVGATLGLGAVVLVGLKYGYLRNSIKLQLLFWFCFAIIAIGLVRTGSRGALVAVVMALFVFPLTRGKLALKIKIGVATLFGVVVLMIASYQIETVRVRWEKTFRDSDLAGRQEIYSYALEMIREQPLIGWGPVSNRLELGLRVGLPERDAHNLYLHLLTEVGFLGALPFFIALCLCLKAAWRASKTIQGALPLAMFVLFLVVNLKGTYLNKKFFWVVLAYSLASATFAVSPVRPYVYLRSRSKRMIQNTVNARSR